MIDLREPVRSALTAGNLRSTMARLGALGEAPQWSYDRDLERILSDGCARAAGFGLDGGLRLYIARATGYIP